MPANLAALSFICASVFVLFLLSRRIRANVPKLALLLWLLAGNVIHGINAVEWAGNVDLSGPVWCDIVTRVLLGANVALPAAFTCIARHLERVSSTRKISNDPQTLQVHRVVDLILCYIFPLFYISLYSIAQDHRFDIIQDYGCSAAVHSSTPALVIIWLPPLLTCSISLIFCGITIHHSFRQSMYQFSEHLSSRSNLTSSHFIRTIATCLVTSAVLGITSLFALFAPPDLTEWTSWDNVHKHFYEIDIVQSRNEINSIQLTWWGFAVVSIVYMVLLVTLGEELRDCLKFGRKKIGQWQASRRKPPPQPLLILHTKASQPPSIVPPSPQMNPAPKALQLKSGWDDMLDLKMPRKRRSKPKLSTLPLMALTHSPSPSPSPSSRISPSPTLCSSPSPTSGSSNPFGPSRTPSLTRSPTSPQADDEVFAAHTMSYLSTPIAHSLGLASPPAAYMSASPQKTSYTNIAPWRAPSQRKDPAFSPDSPTSGRQISATDSQRLLTDKPETNGNLVVQTVPEDAASTISSIWSAPWPQPPATIPDSPASLRTTSQPAPVPQDPRSDSPVLLPFNDAYSYPILSSTVPHALPFQGPTIEPVGSIHGSPSSRPKSSQGVLRRPSLRSLKSWDSFGRGSGSGILTNEVIYMSVVKETV